MGTYAGVDWAAEKHDVSGCRTRRARSCSRAAFAHDEHGLRSLCRQLVRLKVAAGRDRAAGRASGRAAARRGAAVAVRCTPTRSRSARPRFRVSGGQSDLLARVRACELARTDHHRFRVLEPDSDQTKALRAMTRAREDLVQTRTALSNQLRAELERFWPGPIGLFTDLDSPISSAFLKRYPSPRGTQNRWARSACKGSSPVSITPGARQPAQLLAKLKRAPVGRVGEIELQHAPGARALPSYDAQDARRPDQATRPGDRHRRARASRRRDLPVAVQGPRQLHHRRRAAGRDRRLPRSLSDS